jgi:hypothetical protein
VLCLVVLLTGKRIPFFLLEDMRCDYIRVVFIAFRGRNIPIIDTKPRMDVLI